MATEKKPKSRAPKTSAGTARGARKTHLTPLQKILLVNGGEHHSRLRGKATVARAPKRRPADD
jgi:hypothetical protein